MRTLLPATPNPPSPALANGTVFGPYRIVRPLGRGGMGVVYEADEIESGRRVALKVLEEHINDERERERFDREGRLAASINHPHCVSSSPASELDGRMAIAMELMGGTLADRLRPTGRSRWRLRITWIAASWSRRRTSPLHFRSRSQIRILRRPHRTVLGHCQRSHHLLHEQCLGILCGSEDLHSAGSQVDDEHGVVRNQTSPRPHFRREEIGAGNTAPVCFQERLPRRRALRHRRQAARL
jgi:serine/threonine protein kinase